MKNKNQLNEHEVSFTKEEMAKLHDEGRLEKADDDGKLHTYLYQNVDEAKERDYKAEYKKYGSSKKAKKYRAELNAYNRKKGTYGNGDGKDASHKGGKIVGFEKESVNRGRAEKSRLKKEEKLTITVHDLKLLVKEELMNITSINEDWRTEKNEWSSPEAKQIMDDSLRMWSKDLKQVKFRVVKDWMSKAKAGVLDFFDIEKGMTRGDVSRAHPKEVELLHELLISDKIIDRFRSYFGGKKAMNNRLKKKNHYKFK